MAYDAQSGWSRVFVRPTEAARHGTRRRASRTSAAVTGPSVNAAIDDFLAAVDDGSARDRYGRAFTPAAARELHWDLGGHVAEALGAMSLKGVRRGDVEALVYQLAASGLSRRRLQAVAKSVRALFDYAVERELVADNPAQRIALPDEDETEQPTGEAGNPAHPAHTRTLVDHVISMALRVVTLGFLLTAVTLLAESL
jgi:hypothetical protein